MRQIDALAVLLVAVRSALSTTLIPKTVFDTTASLEQYFTYNYPWGGNTHNGHYKIHRAFFVTNTL
jgi:hypothetical protein